MLNKVILQGNFTRDPEMRHTKSGMSVVGFSLACNNKMGNSEEVFFADCTAWDKTAEMIAEHFTKGKQAIVEGRLKSSSWEDKEGNKRSKTEVVVNSIHFVSGGKPSKQETNDDDSGDDESSGDDNDAGSVPF